MPCLFRTSGHLDPLFGSTLLYPSCARLWIFALEPPLIRPLNPHIFSRLKPPSFSLDADPDANSISWAPRALKASRAS